MNVAGARGLPDPTSIRQMGRSWPEQADKPRPSRGARERIDRRLDVLALPVTGNGRRRRCGTSFDELREDVGGSPIVALGRKSTGHGADTWRYLSLSWRAPMREPELQKVPVGLPLPDITFDQFMDIEDSWSTREERV